MPRATPEQYAETMATLDDTPLLHTVIFESTQGVDQPIRQRTELVLAIQRLIAVDGVKSVRSAHLSLDNHSLVEEMVLADSTALQKLRTDPIHDGVVDIARVHANWKVVDRAVPASYDDEPRLINAAKLTGTQPVTHHTVYAFNEGATPADITDSLGPFQEILTDAEDYMLFPSEVAESFDKRKGDVAIIRTGWHSLERSQRFMNSSRYRNAVGNILDIATSIHAVHHS